MHSNFALNSKDRLTLLIKSKNISTWNELTNFIKGLPYGRNANRTDLTLIIKEHKGTCSSKHALLKEVARLNDIPNVKLILGIYKMNTSNTKNIGNVLSKNNLDFIPEAHCYLKIDGERIDYTSTNSDFSKLKNDLLIEKEIEPEQVAKYKVDYHKAYIKAWIEDYNIAFSFEKIWNFREQCIASLSRSN